MYKDTTEFRRRFAEYKKGKLPYKAGIPDVPTPYRYKYGKSPWDDSTKFTSSYEGWSDTTYQNKGDVPTIGYGTTNKKWVSKGRITREQGKQAMVEDFMANEPLLRKNIKNYDRLPDTAKIVLRDILYNVGQGNLFQKSPKFMAAINSGNWEEAARQMDWDNNKPGMGGAIKRNAARQELFLKDLINNPVKPVSPLVESLENQPQFQPVQIKVPVDNTDFSLLNASMQSPAPQSINAWKGKGSPAYGGYSLRIPSLQEYMQTGNIMPRGFKNGKLPGYKIGVIPGNPTNATINQDGTFVDDYTRVFDDLVITPKGPRIKPGQLYKYQEPWDDEKFLNAVTAGGLNNLSPAQWVRRGYDAVTGNLTADSWLNGNAGIVPNKYAKEHPLGAMAANALFDFWTLGGPSLIKNARNVAVEDTMRSLNNHKYYTSQHYYPEYKYSKEHYDFLEWQKSHDEFMKSILEEKPIKPLIAKETQEPNIPTGILEEGVVESPTNRVTIQPVKKYGLDKIGNDVAKDPYIDDANDAWISQMNRNRKDWDYTYARDIIDKNLPDLYEMEDMWVKNGMIGQKPKFYDFYKWREIPEEQRIQLLFDEKIDPKYGTTYFMLKPEYRGVTKLNGDAGNPYGVSPRINIEDPSNGMFTKIPDDIRSKGPFVSNEEELKQAFGEEVIPYSGKINKPIHPRERLDWYDYRNQALEKINQDWNSNGPLSQHLKRSGISDPKILLDYILSPEQAWEVSIKNPGLDLGTILFKTNLEDNVVRNPTYLSGFETSLNKVLRRYGYDNITLDKSKIISTGGIQSQIQKHIAGHNDLNISAKLRKRIDKIYNAAMNDVLKRDQNAAREFYNTLEESYNNAFANHKGGMYIPLKTKNYSNVVSHEFGHLEDGGSSLAKEITGVQESSQVTKAPSAKSALFKKAFNVEGQHKKYFAGYNDENATEMAQRATQVKDFLKLKKGEEVTPEMLQYAIDNYVKDTGMDNNMTEFFNMITDLEAAAKWITVHGKAMIPISVGATAYRKLNPRRKNKYAE